MSAELLARLERGDPDRFLALMAAPPAARIHLLPLYAFNLEVARAPFVTAEPMIAEMRLQWWRDVLAELEQGKPPRAHEVIVPLSAVPNLPHAILDDLIEARRWDIHRDPFPGEDALVAHLDRTAGHLMWAAALALDAPAPAEAAIRAYGRAAGLVAWFRALPAYVSLGRAPLPDPSPDAIAALAGEGLAWLAEARAARASVPRAVAPALLPGWQSGPLLARAARDPAAVAEGRLALSDFARRGRLLLQSVTNRW